MRANVRATQMLISSDCFRLLSLVPEIQNEVEVVKPVLGELEVMRLSCSLGMLSSVNPKDFEMEILEASEFDDDFAIFLRKEIFATHEKHESGGVKVISLFGKQEAVKCELESLNCWSKEVESNLKTEDQGIYCVTHGGGSEEVSLVLFSWIQDCSFRKSRLRDTATYVLRFLTCLSPDIVCCLSADDVEHIERTVAALSSNNLDAWKSFSVAFHVERQEEQKDAVDCESLTSVLLPTGSTSQSVHLLKGSYPAFSLVEPAPAKKWTEPFNQRFDNIKELTTWLVTASKERNLHIVFGGMDPKKLQKELLEATGKWPELELKKVKDMTDRSLQTSEEQARDRVQAYTEDYRATLLGFVDSLFDLDILYKGAKDEPAFVTLNKYVQEVQSNRAVWVKIDAATKVTLTLPLRLKNQLKNIASTFHDHITNATDEENIDGPLVNFMHEFTVSDEKCTNTSDGFVVRAWKKIRGHDVGPLSDQFRGCMAKPMAKARQAWFEAVETVLTIAESVMTNKWNEETQLSLHNSCVADKCKIVCEAFDNLLQSWSGQHEGGLATTVRLRERYPKIYCDMQKENWKPATNQMKVFKLALDDSGIFSKIELGTHRLDPGARLLKAYTIKNHCMILVTTSPEGTFVERVDFPIEKIWWRECVGSVTFKRSFGRPASLCDFDVHDRIVGFVEESGRVVLYRFNETFSSLEIYKRVELSLRTSLALPVTDVLLVDGSLYAIDMAGSIQSVNLSNQQTSRAVQIMPSGSSGYKTSLFAMADNKALGFVVETKREILSDKEPNSALFAISSEDFRDVPVNQSSHVPLPSHNLPVQCFDEMLFAIDGEMKKICVFRLSVTVRSESFRIQHSKEHSVNGTKTECDDSDDHWLRAFYHTYEKFPVHGLIQSANDARMTLKVHLACSSTLSKAAQESCRGFFRGMMRDLRKLNKPLAGMDLARDLRFVTEISHGIDSVAVQPLRSFLQELITFVPIQICRAEGNSLTVMTNGKAQPMNTQSQDVQAVDIARSIRFGLL
ncbi:unnamed protein product [Phytophthora fragariaefolia]|uniref:Unnamed protein product n=1 Tax=Phytophthora fragariaefolia TaxID=1490495 RepID=A0A9W7DBA7_9STRA|nr:unnamed protein product [Phytophthora fragariaefolia]